MEKTDKEMIERIMAGMKCPKGFKCADSGFENLCKAKDYGLESFLKCLEENHKECAFAIDFGVMNFCQCPLRVYLSKNLNK